MQMDTADRTDRLVAGDRQEVVVKSPPPQVTSSAPCHCRPTMRSRPSQPGSVGCNPLGRRWASRSARWLAKWRDWMLDHTDELLAVLQLESGKSWGDSGVDMMPIQIINYWIDNAADFLADDPPRDLMTCTNSRSEVW
jgi:hypothetical protein